MRPEKSSSFRRLKMADSPRCGCSSNTISIFTDHEETVVARCVAPGGACGCGSIYLANVYRQRRGVFSYLTNSSGDDQQHQAASATTEISSGTTPQHVAGRCGL